MGSATCWPRPGGTICGFSSSTARYGRAGQVAYAAANEVLNKTAWRESRARPGCRVVAANWGPWDGGMVTPSLRPLFEAEGVPLIDPAAGASYLVEELRTPPGPGVPIEVVILGASARPEPAAPDPTPPPSGLALAFERRVDATSVPVLASHVIDGRPVLPMALILEWLAEGALQRNPGLSFVGLDNLQILKGVVLRDDRGETLRVLAGKASRSGSAFRVEVELRSIAGDGRDVPHAKATVILADRLPAIGSAGEPLDLPPSDLDPDAIYREILFHGPALQGIELVEGCGPEGIVARVATSPSPSDWIDRPARKAWAADPLALDCAFQMMILWSVERTGAGSLPTGIGRYRQARRAFPEGPIRVVARVTRAEPHKAIADVEFLDEDGSVVARIDDYECVIDASLNTAFRRNQPARAERS